MKKKQMNPLSVILTSLLISILTIWIIAYKLENGDVNAVSMYFVVFLAPIFLLVLANGLLIGIIRNIDSIKFKRILSMIPIPILIFMALGDEIQIPYLDGRLSFVGIVGLISIGLTNLIWNFRLTLKKISEH